VIGERDADRVGAGSDERFHVIQADGLDAHQGVVRSGRSDILGSQVEYLRSAGTHRAGDVARAERGVNHMRQ
jgi:hypothetical protein